MSPARECLAEGVPKVQTADRHENNHNKRQIRYLVATSASLAKFSEAAGLALLRSAEHFLEPVAVVSLCANRIALEEGGEIFVCVCDHVRRARTWEVTRRMIHVHYDGH